MESNLHPVETLAIRIPALPRLTAKKILRKYSFLKSVECDNSPEGEVVLTFATVLRENEGSISGQEYEIRLQSVQGQLGLSQAIWLVEHQDDFPELMALLGRILIDFPNTIALDIDADRVFPYLSQNGLRWYLDWYWFEYDSRSRIAVAKAA